jgi:hypothetical protein
MLTPCFGASHTLIAAEVRAYLNWQPGRRPTFDAFVLLVAK